MFFQGKKPCDTLSDLANKTQVQINLDLRNCDLRKKLDLRKMVSTTKILVNKLFDLTNIFKPCDKLSDLVNKTQVKFSFSEKATKNCAIFLMALTFTY